MFKISFTLIFEIIVEFLNRRINSDEPFNLLRQRMITMHSVLVRVNLDHQVYRLQVPHMDLSQLRRLRYISPIIQP